MNAIFNHLSNITNDYGLQFSRDKKQPKPIEIRKSKDEIILENSIEACGFSVAFISSIYLIYFKIKEYLRDSNFLKSEAKYFTQDQLGDLPKATLHNDEENMYFLRSLKKQGYHLTQAQITTKLYQINQVKEACEKMISTTLEDLKKKEEDRNQKSYNFGIAVTKNKGKKSTYFDLNEAVDELKKAERRYNAAVKHQEYAIARVMSGPEILDEEELTELIKGPEILRNENNPQAKNNQKQSKFDELVDDKSKTKQARLRQKKQMHIVSKFRTVLKRVKR